MTERYDELQRQEKHRAPCARHCEAIAFAIELRRLRGENRRLTAALLLALPELEQEAEQREYSGNDEYVAPVRKAADAAREALCGGGYPVRGAGR